MMLVVTFVSFLIHLYSAEFMSDDEGYSRFFAYMNLFVASMLVLVLADNLLLLYLGWEGVGLCSYLLIGFWYRDPANGRAARKAFIVTRVGDTAMAIGLFSCSPVGHARHPAADAARRRALAGGIGAADRRGGAAARRRGRQIRAAAAADLAARRHGRPDAGQRAHPCRDHGDGRRLSDRAHACALRACAAGRRLAVAVIGAPTLLLAGFSALNQTRYQAHPGLLDDQPDRLHVPGARGGRLVGGHLPLHDACLLQGAAVPLRRRRRPAPRRGTRYLQDGRTAAAICRSPSGVSSSAASRSRRCP